MKRSGIVTICFLAVTSLATALFAQHKSTEMPSEPKALSADLAKQLYALNQNMKSQQTLVQKAHEKFLTALANYRKKDSAANKKTFLAAITADAEAAQAYAQMVQDAKSKIDQAAGIYYEETPATKKEIEAGPIGKGTPTGGESVAIEIPQAPPFIENNLKNEIESNGGISSPFAEQLRAQMQNLKNVQDRIKNEEQDPAVTTNPAAQDENSNLLNALQKAVEARRKALGYQK